MPRFPSAATASPQTPAPKQQILLAALICAGSLASILILAAARGDLWFDEILSIKMAQPARTPFDILLGLRHDNNHPLNTLYVHYLPKTRFFLAYRAVSVLAGIGSLVMLAQIAMRQWGRAEAILAVVLAGTSYPLVLYSSEARGYATAVFFALLAYHLLSQNLEEFRWRRVYGFWAASILGILSQATFLIVSGALIILQLADAFQGSQDRRPKLQKTLQHQVPVLLFFGAWWIVFLHGMYYGAGPEYKKWDVICQAASLLIGMPDVAPFNSLSIGMSDGSPFNQLALGIVLAVAVGGAVCLARDRNIRWVFYPSVLVLVPAALILITRPQFFYFRYLLVSFPFFYLLLAYLACRLFRRSAAPFRGLMILACGLMISGQAIHILPLLTLGRGSYLRALTDIVEQDPGSVVRIGSDHPNRNLLLIEFYAPLLPPGKTLEYIEDSRLWQSPPGWFLVHSQELNLRPSPTLIINGIGNYRLTGTYPYAGVSGWNWYLYRRETHADSPSRTSSP